MPCQPTPKVLTLLIHTTILETNQGCHLSSSLVSQSGVSKLLPVGQDKGESLGLGVDGTNAPDFQHGVNNNLSIRLQGEMVVVLVPVEQLSQVVTQLVIVRVIVILFFCLVMVIITVVVMVIFVTIGQSSGTAVGHQA